MEGCPEQIDRGTNQVRELETIQETEMKLVRFENRN